MWKRLELPGFSKQNSRFRYTYLDNWGHGKKKPLPYALDSCAGQRNKTNNVNKIEQRGLPANRGSTCQLQKYAEPRSSITDRSATVTLTALDREETEFFWPLSVCGLNCGRCFPDLPPASWFRSDWDSSKALKTDWWWGIAAKQCQQANKVNGLNLSIRPVGKARRGPPQCCFTRFQCWCKLHIRTVLWEYSLALVGIWWLDSGNSITASSKLV